MGAVSKSKRDTKHQSISLLISLSFYFREKMNSLALVLLLATGLSAVSAGIDDIVDVHNGNANEFADSVRRREEKRREEKRREEKRRDGYRMIGTGSRGE